MILTLPRHFLTVFATLSLVMKFGLGKQLISQVFANLLRSLMQVLSDVLVLGTIVTTTGPVQEKPGAYIFNGLDENPDYLTLQGNNDNEFTIAMWVRPDISQAMDISKCQNNLHFPLVTGHFLANRWQN